MCCSICQNQGRTPYYQSCPTLSWEATGAQEVSLDHVAFRSSTARVFLNFSHPMPVVGVRQRSLVVAPATASPPPRVCSLVRYPFSFWNNHPTQCTSYLVVPCLLHCSMQCSRCSLLPTRGVYLQCTGVSINQCGLASLPQFQHTHNHTRLSSCVRGRAPLRHFVDTVSSNIMIHRIERWSRPSLDL
jgi:hypothetical protein